MDPTCSILAMLVHCLNSTNLTTLTCNLIHLIDSISESRSQNKMGNEKALYSDICDRYLSVDFDRFEIFALSKRQLNKLSYDTKFITIGLILLKVQEKDGVFFLLFSFYLKSYFAQYLKISLADLRYLLLRLI